MKLLTVSLGTLLALFVYTPLSRLVRPLLDQAGLPVLVKLWASPTLALVVCSSAAYLLLPRLGFSSYRNRPAPNPKLLVAGAVLCLTGSFIVSNLLSTLFIRLFAWLLNGPGIGYMVGALQLAMPWIGALMVAAGLTKAKRSAGEASPAAESFVPAGVVVAVFMGFLVTDVWQSVERTNELARLPWDSDSGTPEARALMTVKCARDAGETISGTAEGVESILISGSLLEGDRPLLKLGRGTDYTNPNYAFSRLGLGYIERTAPAESGTKYTRFDLHTKTAHPIESATSRYAVAFERITTADEEALWVHGRRVEVRDTQTAEVLATRIEFFWLPRDHSVTHEPYSGRTGVCPALNKRQETPTSFLSHVINPVSYGCWYKMEEQPVRGTEFILECDRQYWAARQ